MNFLDIDSFLAGRLGFFVEPVCLKATTRNDGYTMAIENGSFMVSICLVNSRHHWQNIPMLMAELGVAQA